MATRSSQYKISERRNTLSNASRRKIGGSKVDRATWFVGEHRHLLVFRPKFTPAGTKTAKWPRKSRKFGRASANGVSSLAS